MAGAAARGELRRAAAEEGRALAERAPVDLRVNSLKTNRDKALGALAHLKPEPTPFSPIGLRIAVRPDGRAPPLASEPAYVKGLVEVQDEGSQLAALLAEAKPGMQVLDLCAGAGGKTLALAAVMDNQGQIYATDTDWRRLAPIFARLERSGARNVQVRAPRGTDGRAGRPRGALRSRVGRRAVQRLGRLAAQSRRQVADASLARWSSGSRIRIETLETAARYVKPGGRIVYVTCSVLEAENEDRVSSFLEAHADFLPLDAAQWRESAGLPALAEHASRLGAGLPSGPAAHRDRRLLHRGLGAT